MWLKLRKSFLYITIHPMHLANHRHHKSHLSYLKYLKYFNVAVMTLSSCFYSCWAPCQYSKAFRKFIQYSVIHITNAQWFWRIHFDFNVFKTPKQKHFWIVPSLEIAIIYRNIEVFAKSSVKSRKLNAKHVLMNLKTNYKSHHNIITLLLKTLKTLNLCVEIIPKSKSLL